MNQICIILFFLALGACSPNSRHSDENKSKIGQTVFLNTYKVFNEPDTRTAIGLRYYLLIVCHNSFDSTRMISIRQDSSATYVDNKMASFTQIPSIQRVTDFDSTSFFYSTIHSKISNSEVDTINRLGIALNIAGMKDSVNSNHLDGGMREIILFDGKNIYHVYRSFGSVKELEPNLILFIEKIMKRYHKTMPRLIATS